MSMARQKARDDHAAAGNVPFKHASPESEARMARKRGKEEVAARKLAILMGEEYHLPRYKRGRKASAPIEVSPLAVRVVASDECPELVATTIAATVVEE